jgi:hypothetical protein
VLKTAKKQDDEYNIGFEVLTATLVKHSFFWNITPYGLLKVNRRFGEHSKKKPSKKPPIREFPAWNLFLACLILRE